MTAEQIINRLEEFFGDSERGVSRYAFNEFTRAEGFNNEVFEDLNWQERNKEALKQLGLGDIKEVEQFGGEGEGDTWYTVKHFVDHNIYIQTDGFYSSYNGTDFYHGFGHEVEPKEVKVIQYHAVKK